MCENKREYLAWKSNQCNVYITKQVKELDYAASQPKSQVTYQASHLSLDSLQLKP